MELKVWVDGIQRVVCGVTDSSTCQDVVYALAHATGQTGRFTLVEKWRNSERLLAPHEQPLKVLTKWGEYANDVHFVMRRSQSDGGGKSQKQQPNNQFAQNNKRQHDFLHNFSPTGSNQNQKQAPNSKELKKSLTFSCGHANSGSEGSTPCTNNNNNVPSSKSDRPPPPPAPPLTSNCMEVRDAKSRRDVPKGVVRGIPQKPRDNDSPKAVLAHAERPKHPPPYDEAVSRSSGRFAPSHLSLASPTLPSSTDEESPSSKRRHLAARTETTAHSKGNGDQPYVQQHPKAPSSQTRDTSSTNSPERIIGRAGHLNNVPSREKSPSKSSFEKTAPSPQKSAYIDDVHSTKTKKSVLGRFEDENHIPADDRHVPVSAKSGLNHSEDTIRDPQYQDLMRLVTLQREKMENQQAELMQFDAEIVYWEGRLQEQEDKLRILQEEMSRLDRMQQEQDGELTELDRRPFNEEVELGRQEERTLRSELTLARSQLANCETELLQCHQRIRLLLEEITEERRLHSLREEQEKKDIEEQEGLLQQQLEILQQQVEEKSSEAENQKTATDHVREELYELENKISDKQKEVEKLIEDIRNANLYSLSLIPTEDGKFIAEGNFCNRPGSTRKIIGSPRQLENAVPTNKNPHGVWV